MNKVLLDLGFIEIRWYSIIMLFAILSASYVILRESKKKGFTEDFLNNLFFYTIICAIIGARLYYVAFNFHEYQNDLLGIFRIWEGGLAIHGGIIGGLLFITYYTKKYKVNELLLLDIIVVGLIILLIIRKQKYTKVGELTGTYLIWYGIVRFLIEILRQDALMLGPIKIAQLVSIIMIIIGLIMIIKAKKTSRFENLYKEARVGEIKF